MNLSLDTILSNARELVSRLRRDDAVADSAVSQAQFVQERVLSMKQVQSHEMTRFESTCFSFIFSTVTI